MLCLAAIEPLVLQVRLPQTPPEGVPAAIIAAPVDTNTAEEVVISGNDDDDFQPGSDQKAAPRPAGQLCLVGCRAVLCGTWPLRSRLVGSLSLAAPPLCCLMPAERQ